MGAARERHPVRRELAALLAAVSAGLVLLVALYSAQIYVRSQDEGLLHDFHEQAVALARELKSAYFSARAPRGLEQAVRAPPGDPAGFTAQAELAYREVADRTAALLELYARHPAPPFDRSRARLARAVDELHALRSRHDGDPEGFARAFAITPLYAEMVAQQIERQHVAQVRAMRISQARTTLASWIAFLAAAAALTAIVLLRARRNVRAIDAILADERAAAAALRASEAALKEAQHIGRLGSWTLDLDTGRIEWSDEIFRIFEVERRRFGATYEEFLRLVHPEDRAALDEAYRRSLEERMPYEFQHRLLMPDGRVKHVLEAGRSDYDAWNRPVRSTGIVQDITERVRTERELNESLERFRHLADNIRDVFWITSIDSSEIQYVSPAFADVWGRSREQLRKHPEMWLEAIAPEFRAQVAAALPRLAAGEIFEADYQIVRPDGTRRWIHDRGYPVRGPGGSLIRVVGVAEDITDRKAAEEKLRAALAEKEVLLREIYHRVKNNMQVVASLLAIQGRAAGPGRAQRLLLESAERVKSMALVHEQLYQSRDVAHIALSEYLGMLLDRIAHIYSAPSRGISIDVNVVPTEIGIDHAVPVGLIVYELVSNAFKHAFAEGGGAIHVALQALGEGELELTVRDDGKGIPEGWAPGNGDGLGAQLVTALVGQIGGTFRPDFGAGRGACFTVRFPRPDRTRGAGER